MSGSQAGHNGQLKSIVERIENIETSIKEHQDDRKDVYAEAKGQGFDVAAIRAIVKMRKEDANKRAERETILETYMVALGMAQDVPAVRESLARVSA